MTEFSNMHHIGRHRRSSEEWWQEKTLPEKILLGISFALIGVAMLALCGWITMLLWNWLMPYLFGLKTVTYWQAWGILLLSSLLFKGVGKGGGPNPSDRKRKQKLRTYLHDERLPDTVLADNK